jgi:putative ABC transport system permease protein
MLKQIVSVTAMNFKSLPQRFWPSLVIIVGMACVIGVMLSMMSMAEGWVTSVTSAGDTGHAYVFSAQAQNETQSNVPRAWLGTVADAPAVAKDSAGKPLADPEILVNVPMVRKADGLDGGMLLRGVGPQGIAIRPQIKLVAGRMFRPGARELIVGKAAQGQFAGTGLGDKVTLPDGQWPIVGVFTSKGDFLEGQLFGDLDTIMTANKKSAYSAVLVKLTSPAAYETFRRAITTNPALQAAVERQVAYYQRTTGQNAAVLNGITYVIGAVMAIGAVFGALNTMYSAVGARTREIATLRALGFGSTAVVISVISESLLLALTGSLIGAAIAWLLFDGNQKALGANVFNLTVSPHLILIGIIWALVVGLIGGLLPSIRAARLPVASAIRAT